MPAARKKAEAKAPISSNLPDLVQLTRDLLSENGEQPDRWIIVERKETHQYRLFCGAPPFPLFEDNGPLLDLAYDSNASLGLLFTLDKNEIEIMLCASFGYLGYLLCDGTHAPEDFVPGYVELQRSTRHDQPVPALRAALTDLIRLGYHFLTHQTSPFFNESRVHSSQFTVHSSESENLSTQHSALNSKSFPIVNRQSSIVNPIRVEVRRDGSMAVGQFRPEATLNQLSEAMAGMAPKAKLTRMRQTAKDCGGCGRCCHDPNIPLTYFDVESVANHRFPDLYKTNRSAALTRTHDLLAFPRQPEPYSMLTTPPLTFRKKDGSGGANSPCVFLDGRGLCGVYLGRPLLCRLYHCAESSVALDNLYKSAFCTVEWFSRVVEAGAFRPPKPITLPQLLEQPLIKLVSPYALAKTAEEIAGQTNRKYQL
jgi:Fe-S-cluster containining protein